MNLPRETYLMLVIGVLALVVVAVLPGLGQPIFLLGFVFGVLFSAAALISEPRQHEEPRDDRDTN